MLFYSADQGDCKGQFRSGAYYPVTEEIQPALVSFHSDLKTSVGKAFLANAITLTPGTITVTLEDSEYVVHCLDEELAVGMAESVFVERLTELEKK